MKYDGVDMAQRGEFRVSVSKDDLVFSSAHFITFAGHRCEGLHGHNYRVRAAIDGELDPADRLIFDFLELKRIMRKLCGDIDHLVLLPTKSARIAIVEDADTVRVDVDGHPRYVFPRRDCALLPVVNTTVERLAELLADRLRAELDAAAAARVTAIEVEVEENFGQSARYRMAVS